MNIEKLFLSEIKDHITVSHSTIHETKIPFINLCEIAITALENGNKIMFFGNGGSAADAQHLAAELIVRYKINRDPIPGIALTTDSSTITAGANDFGFNTIFENQIKAIGRQGDVAIGLSTSGNSENVIRAFKVAKNLDIATVAFTGGRGGQVKNIASLSIVVPSTVIARIQEMHILLGHMFCDVIEQSIGNRK